MSAQQTGTVLTTLKIDVSPDGIKFTIEGLESDLASLIAKASTFTAQEPIYATYDKSDVVIMSDRMIEFVAKPVVVPPVTP